MFFVRILFFCDFWLVRFMKKVKVLLHVPRLLSIFHKQSIYPFSVK